jgi:hypothetical protein
MTRLLDGQIHEVRRDSRRQAVGQRPPNGRHLDGSHPRPIDLGNVGVGEDHALGYPEPPLAPVGRHREVDLRGQHVREFMQGEGRLVGEDSSAVRPEPDRGQVLVLTWREVDEPVDAPAHAPHPAGAEVLLQELGGVARLGRLRGREEAVLTCGQVEQVVPARMRLATVSSAMKAMIWSLPPQLGHARTSTAKTFLGNGPGPAAPHRQGPPRARLQRRREHRALAVGARRRAHAHLPGPRAPDLAHSRVHRRERVRVLTLSPVSRLLKSR